MKEREPNCKTPHRNFNSLSDETHGKSELTVHKQSRGYKRNKKIWVAKSIRMIHSTFGSQSNTIRYNVRARAWKEILPQFLLVLPQSFRGKEDTVTAYGLDLNSRIIDL